MTLRETLSETGVFTRYFEYFKNISYRFRSELHPAEVSWVTQFVQQFTRQITKNISGLATFFVAVAYTYPCKGMPHDDITAG